MGIATKQQMQIGLKQMGWDQLDKQALLYIYIITYVNGRSRLLRRGLYKKGKGKRVPPELRNS